MVVFTLVTFMLTAVVRPAINLAKGVIIEEGGNGTISNPYVIK